MIPVGLNRRAALLGATFLVACASAPEPKPVAKGPVFYPAAPDAPRIQHLVSFSGERDFAGSRSAFATFVAGEARGE